MSGVENAVKFQMWIWMKCYGVFVLTAREDEKDNGCIINTAIQAASEPNQLSICVNKANYTHDMIQRTGKFTVSVLSQKAQFEILRCKSVALYISMKEPSLSSKLERWLFHENVHGL